MLSENRFDQDALVTEAPHKAFSSQNLVHVLRQNSQIDKLLVLQLLKHVIKYYNIVY